MNGRQISSSILLGAERSSQLLLRGHNLRNVPEEVWSLHTIKVLDLSENRFTELSPRIQDLSSLYYLNLDNNEELHSLPNELCKLNELKFICLMNCFNMDKEIMRAYDMSKSAPVRFGLSARDASKIKEILFQRLQESYLQEEFSQLNLVQPALQTSRAPEHFPNSSTQISQHPPHSASEFSSRERLYPDLKSNAMLHDDPEYQEYLLLKQKFSRIHQENDSLQLRASSHLPVHATSIHTIPYDNRQDNLYHRPQEHLKDKIRQTLPFEDLSSNHPNSTHISSTLDFGSSSRPRNDTQQRLFPTHDEGANFQSSSSPALAPQASSPFRRNRQEYTTSAKVGDLNAAHDISAYINARKNIISRHNNPGASQNPISSRTSASPRVSTTSLTNAVVPAHYDQSRDHGRVPSAFGSTSHTTSFSGPDHTTLPLTRTSGSSVNGMTPRLSRAPSSDVFDRTIRPEEVNVSGSYSSAKATTPTHQMDIMAGDEPYVLRSPYAQAYDSPSADSCDVSKSRTVNNYKHTQPHTSDKQQRQEYNDFKTEQYHRESSVSSRGEYLQKETCDKSIFSHSDSKSTIQPHSASGSFTHYAPQVQTSETHHSSRSTYEPNYLIPSHQARPMEHQSSAMERIKTAGRPTFTAEHEVAYLQHKMEQKSKAYSKRNDSQISFGSQNIISSSTPSVSHTTLQQISRTNSAVHHPAITSYNAEHASSPLSQTHQSDFDAASNRRISAEYKARNLRSTNIF